MTLNQNKILKDLIVRVDKSFDQRKIGNDFPWNYDVLKNYRFLKQYQEDPDFKKLLIKAKIVHDEYMAKYGNIEVIE